MNKINQALFGYSNGHRLLASSIKLSTSSLRLMEMLSDLSGNQTSKNSDGYYTGCWLFEEDCYAICKTWYATEMPRPGCAWTHAVFLESSTFSTSVNIDIDSLFSRPEKDKNNFSSCYSIPLVVQDSSFGTYENLNRNVSWLLDTIISEKENIAFCSDNTIEINHTFEHLLQLMGVGFFKNFTFCSASQSNRMIKEKPLTFQVFSSNVSKVALRSLTVIHAPESQSKFFSPTSADFIDYLIKIKQFALSCEKKYYSFEYFETIKNIYDALYNSTGVKLLLLISIVRESFANEQTAHNFLLFLDIFIKDALSETRMFPTLINLFIDIAVLGDNNNDFSNALDIFIYEKYMQELYYKDPSSVFELISKLLCSELNLFGEKLIKALAFIIDSSAFLQMLSKGNHHYTVLLQWNWRLAENALLWRSSSVIQSEMIKNISVAFKKVSDADKNGFSKILYLIFENCSTDIANETYLYFGDFSISTYLVWVNQNNCLSQNGWLCICKNNSYISLIVINSFENATIELFYNLLRTINPWDISMRCIEVHTLEQLYCKFCRTSLNSQLDDLFATFTLQVIINSNIKLSDEVAKFVFMRVHKILETPDFDNKFWNAISPHLPEIKWYNSWDKCKRLRKFAQKNGYNDIFI